MSYTISLHDMLMMLLLLRWTLPLYFETIPHIPSSRKYSLFSLLKIWNQIFVFLKIYVFNRNHRAWGWILWTYWVTEVLSDDPMHHWFWSFYGICWQYQKYRITPASFKFRTESCYFTAQVQRNYYIWLNSCVYTKYEIISVNSVISWS